MKKHPVLFAIALAACGDGTAPAASGAGGSGATGSAQTGSGASSSTASGTSDTVGTGSSATGGLTLRFQNTFAGEPLTLGKEYATTKGKPVSFAKVRFWISNVVLTDTTGQEHAIEGSYFLVEQTADTTRSDVALEGIPAAQYDGVAFGLGVDAAHNHSTDVFVGELSTNVDMDWGWNSGFIFLKTEGKYFNENNQAMKSFLAHVGTDANYQTVTLALGPSVTVDGTTTPEVTIAVDTAKLANGYDFNQKDALQFGPGTKDVIDAFATGFAAE